MALRPRPLLMTGPGLRRRSATPAWLSLLLRLVLALGLIALALAVNLIDRDGLKDQIDGRTSFSDVLYFTMITITTVGYGDIVPVTDRARLFDAFLLTPIRLFVWLIFVGTAYDFVLRGLMGRWRMALIERTLKDHVVVAGYGTSGAEAVAELLRSGLPPAQVVVIDPEPEAVAAAEACGVAVMQADATRNTALEGARIDRARAVIVSAGRDDTSILIVLTARRLSPRAPISVVIRSADNESLARQAGADTVINPPSFAGLLLAGSTQALGIADYMADLAGSHGSVLLRERPATRAEIGRPLREIGPGVGLRIRRQGRAIGFWEADAARLEPGDLIVEVVPRAGDDGGGGPAQGL